MNPSDRKPRRPRSPALNPELLEKREMLTGGVGDTFAILPATIKKAGGQTSVEFTLDPKLFQSNGKKPFVLGIDVAPGTSASTNPVVKSVTAPNGKTLAVQHSVFDPKVSRTGVQSGSKMSSAALVTIPGFNGKSTKPLVYKVNVSALDKSAGDLLVGFYLPGDSSGSGTVNQASINSVQYALNTNANDTTGKYNFDADANRDGRIDKKDLKLTKQNMGVTITVSPVISADLSPNGITDPKQRISNVPNVVVTGTATPGASITYSATGLTTQTVAADATTGAYSVPLQLNVGSNIYSVEATDDFKQKISGTIAAITYDPAAVPVADTVATDTATATATTTATATA